MDFGIKPVTFDCACVSCKKEFKYTACGTGPVNLCDKCADELTAFIFGDTDVCPQWAMAQ